MMTEQKLCASEKALWCHNFGRLIQNIVSKGKRSKSYLPLIEVVTVIAIGHVEFFIAH